MGNEPSFTYSRLSQGNSRRVQMKGVTLFELIIVVAVISILFAVAAPSFQSAAANSAVTSETNRLVASVQYARSEAVKRNAAVVMGRLSGTNFTWGEGWQIYEDDSGDNGGSAYTAADDTLVRTTGASAQGVTITSDNAGNNWLAFRGNGMTSEVGFAVYHICYQNDPTSGRRVTINLAGRTTVDDIPANQTCTPP